jgi:hypothetical protein
MRRQKYVCAFLALLFCSVVADAQFIPRELKLIGDGLEGWFPSLGNSVSLSRDGNTLLVGAYQDNYDVGCALIFTRTNGIWSQLGAKLVGTGAIGLAAQGTSVAVSADGSTAIIGGFGDDNTSGAAWVFKKNAESRWIQEAKLVGSGAIGTASQGIAVALSSDGDTAVVGGPSDNNSVGATWVFMRQNGIWAQQGDKLVGSGGLGQSNQGSAVAISADGNTIIIGGPSDDQHRGATWSFHRNYARWEQESEKLTIAESAWVERWFGSSVAISGDGATVLVGGPQDGFPMLGAAWVFGRISGQWTNPITKLIGSPNQGFGRQGQSVALSSDGNMAVIGAPQDGEGEGRSWVFLQRDGIWREGGTSLIGRGAIGTGVQQGRSVAISGDGITIAIGGPFDSNLMGAVWVFALGERKPPRFK